VIRILSWPGQKKLTCKRSYFDLFPLKSMMATAIPQLSWRFRAISFAVGLMSSTKPRIVEERRAAMYAATRPGFIMGYPAEMKRVHDSEIVGVPVRYYVPVDCLPGTCVDALNRG
jgi:hypothetical protein